MDFTNRIWPQLEPRLGDPDSFEAGYGMHPALLKLRIINGAGLPGPDPRTRLDLRIGWKKVSGLLTG